MDKSGFRGHHSTETALDKEINNLLLASDQGCLPLQVLLDLSDFSDTTAHTILHRLENVVDVKETVLSRLRSYLTHCKSKW